MKRKLKVRGQDYRLDAEAGAEDETQKAQDAVGELEQAAERKDQDLAEAGAKCEALQKALTDALSQCAQLQAQIAAKAAMAAPPVTEEQVPEDVLDSALTKREALRADARAVLGESVKLEGVKPAEIKRQVVAKALPSVKLDGLPSDTIEGMYLAAVAGARAASATRSDALARAGGAALPSVHADGEGKDHSQKLQERLEAQGSQPIFGKGS